MKLENYYREASDDDILEKRNCKTNWYHNRTDFRVLICYVAYAKNLNNFEAVKCVHQPCMIVYSHCHCHSHFHLQTYK